MNWTQVIDPLNNMALSALVAAIPVFFIFWALVIRKMKGFLASILTMVIAVFIALFVYRMPPGLAVLSTVHGALYGLFPIAWIIITAVYLYNITVKSGQFEIIKDFMASITADRRLQALLIAFSFGSFLEGTAGMGTPVAITAAMLSGLGFNPLYAAGICLIANTAPVAFGGVGVPITVASQVSGIPEMAISQMVGRTLPFLSVVVPFYLVVLMSGFKKSLEVLPAILVTGLTFAFFQWLTANYLNPMLPDVIAGLASIVALAVLLRFWKPKNTWHFENENRTDGRFRHAWTTSEILRAWSPFIIMTVMIIGWGIQPVKDALNSLGMVKFDFPGLHNRIVSSAGNNVLVAQNFKFNYLSASGTAILLSALLSVVVLKMKFTEAVRIFKLTLIQLKFPIITIASVLGFAYIANNSGMSVTMARALTGTGLFYPFFAPVLGWLGVFLTGSDTSSNALFGKLQHTTAGMLGIDPVVTVSANATGGVTGKMISPQSIAVGVAAVGLVGKESDLFRFTFKHSFIFLFIICILTVIQAYVFKWIIPVYQVLDSQGSSVKVNPNSGFIYLGILVIVLAGLMALFGYQRRRKVTEKGR